MHTESRICVSIGNVPYDTIPGILEKVDMAEIRIDLAGLDENQVRRVFSSHGNLIATCREGAYNDGDRARLLEAAVISGAAWVDIEADADPRWREIMTGIVRKNRCRLIISMHYYTHTPPPAELRKVAAEMYGMDADVVKIAAQVNHPSEAASLMGLYSEYKNLVAIGMGPLGVITRIVIPFLGAPFTFASFGDNPLTAAGQVDYGEMSALIDKISSYG